jgi:hypothetical protein
MTTDAAEKLLVEGVQELYYAEQQLFGGSFAGDPRSHGLVRFLLSGAIVTVHSDGRLTVEPEDGDATQQSVVA